MIHISLAFSLLTLYATEHLDLYTMGPGDRIYDRFGHAAICIHNENHTNRSRCYNFGTANFDTPPRQLGWEIARGTSRFWVSRWIPEKMIDLYRQQDRDVWRQHLPIATGQLKQAKQYLEEVVREENRYYTYHHLDNNCATQIRDLLDRLTQGSFCGSFEQPYGERSYREIIASRLAGRSPALGAMTVLGGRRLDRIPNGCEAMFLPSILRDTTATHFAAPPENVNRSETHRYAQLREPPASGDTALAISAGGLLLAALAAFARFPACARTFSCLVGLLLGAVALCVWSIALVSHIPELRFNEALWVLWPTDLLYAGRRWQQRVRYARFRSTWLLGCLGLNVSGLLHQPLLGLILWSLLPALVFSLKQPTGQPKSAPRRVGPRLPH
ncbi:MAG: DUF4105 domain-containing protein [Nannocystaceae bacterium]